MYNRLGPLGYAPRAEVLTRRRRVIMSGLWLSAPALWLLRHFMTVGDGNRIGWLEIVVMICSNALLMVGTVALRLRPEVGRGLALIGLVGCTITIAAHSLDAPHIAFLGLSSIALLGYGLFTQDFSADVPSDPKLSGHLWARAILNSSILALLLGGLSYAYLDLSPSLLRGLVSVLFLSASAVSLAAEREIVLSGQWPGWSLKLLAGVTLAGFIISFFSELGLLVLAIRLIFSVVWAVKKRNRSSDILGLAQLHPARFAVGSFSLGALIGALALALPAASASGKSIPIVDALFTATSAICVTGLVTISTGSDLSFLGQFIVLLLIQMGGLGIMTLSAMIVLAAGRQLTGSTEQALGESIGSGKSPSRIFDIIRAIAVATILIESAGALLIFLETQSDFATTTEAAWFAIFHAVSAFCNAGFALQDDSLVKFADRPIVLHTLSALIILGGVGFGIMLGVVKTTINLLRTRFQRLYRWNAPKSRRASKRFDVNVKLVATVTTGLLVAGAVLFAGLEWNRSLAGLDWYAKLNNAWFQSVTLRTAGFNSVDLARMGPASIMVALLLMFIGASPASTGGGIKTSTFAVLCLSLSMVFSKKRDTEVFGRRIEPEVVSRAVAVTIFSLAAVFVGSFLLMLTQDAPFDVLMFEATSAIATAGLSIGGTAALDNTGKIIVIVLMIIGRVGPITTAALWQNTSKSRRRYPKAEVIVG